MKMKIKSVPLGKIINILAGATFGVYLIHEHRNLRYLWQQWLDVEQSAGQPWMIFHLIGSVLAVFVVCAGVELLRKWLFGLITERKWFGRIFEKFSKLEDKINGDA